MSAFPKIWKYPVRIIFPAQSIHPVNKLSNWCIMNMGDKFHKLTIRDRSNLPTKTIFGFKTEEDKSWFLLYSGIDLTTINLTRDDY